MTAEPATRVKSTVSALRTGQGRRRVNTVAFHVTSIVLACIFLAPLVWAVLSSFKSPAEANQAPPTWFPHHWSLGSYSSLVHFLDGLWTYTRNSLVVSFLTVVGTVVLCVLAGYGFARYEFLGKRLLFASTLAILAVPYATILLPLFIVIQWLHLQNSLLGLALVLVMFQLPFGVYMMRNSFESVPRELEEAARADGCSTFGALRHVSLRIVSPGIVTVALFSFIASWNDLLAPLIFLQDGSKYTLPIMLVTVRSGEYGAVNYGAMQAGIVVAMVPCLLLYLLLQRFYVRGLLNGALKG